MNLEQIREETLRSLGMGKLNSGVYHGVWADTHGRESIESFSPIDGKTTAEITVAGDADYSEIIEKAINSFERWRDIPAPRRGMLIREIGEELRKNKQQLGRLVSLEAGKTVTEGEGEIQEMIDVADLAVGLSRQLYGLEIASERPKHRMIEQYVPLGVTAVITSFNFPASVWSWNAFIAAVCGDVVVWKPSSKAALVAVAVMRVAERVVKRLKYPDPFFLAVGEGSSIGDRISKDNRIPLVSFTGSIPVGKKISENVSKRLGKVILELGGNNAAVVSDKAEMKIAVKGVAFGALATAGQRCTSTRRVIVHEKIYSAFTEKLIDVYRRVKRGNPLEPDTVVGPLIDQNAVKSFKAAIEEAKKEGGKLLFGGTEESIDGFPGGHYVMPAIIEATPEMKITEKETFAPILYVFRYRNLEEAIKIHNSVPQGLSSSIFTQDLAEAEEFTSARGSDCGIVNVNTATAGAEIGGAFGGEKETGGGRESGSDAWKNYMRRQTVTINYGEDIPLSQDVRFPV
ncbi:MAG: aldehyde dehydrogenase family protein [Candidatus Thermoplasmatota archaeon]|nr:aldehyde dehydrogenase family protein [Candidatus Thermoplasmatota archaeon]MCL5731728.1 aldehyde dehydrogenase family protein [Candidatus Thermoplasmatota archaeon]